jgi:hypothetical protein
MRILFSTQYGSKLYGTNNAASDTDLKHVVLPSLNDLLLGKTVQNVVKKTNKKEFTKNSAEDTDEEFIPIQIFATHFLEGQTYSLELAYAVDFTEAFQIVYDPAFKDFCHELRDKFLTSNMSALIGYAVNQASLYSFKGERLNAVRAVKNVYETFINILTANSKPTDCLTNFNLSMQEISFEFPKYVQVTEYAIDRASTMRPCIKLLEKVLPYTSTFETNLAVVKSHLKKYGSRADAASVDNVDWKASGHALRVVDEGIMLLKNRYLEFPFQNNYVDLLLQIKNGQLPYSDVIAMLNERLEELKTLEITSALPKKSPELIEQFDAWLVNWLRYFYNLQ